MHIRNAIRKNNFVNFCSFLWHRATQYDMTNTAATLTLSTLTALVPTLTFLFFLFSQTFAFQAYSLYLLDYIASFLEIEAFNSILAYLQTLPEKIANLSLLGAIILLISATFLMFTIESSFNKMWQVEKPRQLFQRLIVDVFILLLAPFTLVLLVSGWNFYIKDTLFLSSFPQLTAFGYFLFSFLLYVAIVFLIFRFVPYCYVPAKDALIGAVFTTLGLILLKKIFSFYVAKFNNYELIYGAFAAIPLFILYVYLLWYILLIGALFTSGLSSLKNKAFKKQQVSTNQFEDAVRVLTQLGKGKGLSEGFKIQELHQRVKMGYDDLSGLMNRLRDLGYVKKEGFIWSLNVPVNEITLIDLYHEFVLPAGPKQKDACGLTLYDLLRKNRPSLEVTLQEFLALTHGR